MYIPEDILHIICSYLKNNDLGFICQVSSSFNKIARQNVSMKELRVKFNKLCMKDVSSTYDLSVIQSIIDYGMLQWYHNLHLGYRRLDVNKNFYGLEPCIHGYLKNIQILDLIVRNEIIPLYSDDPIYSTWYIIYNEQFTILRYNDICTRWIYNPFTKYKLRKKIIKFYENGLNCHFRFIKDNKLRERCEIVMIQNMML